MAIADNENIVVVDAVPVESIRTRVREKVTPFLPPPVVTAIRDVDPLLEPYVGPEACVTLTGSLLLSVLVWQLVKALSSLSGRGRAVVDDDEEDVAIMSSKHQDFGDTVLLCGPTGAGKTRLFYALCHDEYEAPTVTSLRTNVGYVDTAEQPVRVMDYPGHASWQSPQLQTVLQSVSRYVLVLDSTQPVAPAADVLYQILSYSSSNNSNKASIFVACHKVDAPNSKNWRRIKIQLRTELERLLKVRATEDASKELWWPPGKPLDLDGLDHVELCFGSTSCNEEGMKDMLSFCLTGDIPKAPEKTPQIRRV